MSAPTPDEEDQALASLAGASVPVDVDRAVTRLRLIGDAREAGVPWASIGASLGGMSGKAAKAAAKRLARDTRRQLAAAQREGSIGPFPGQYGQPHVYARDVHSGAGNCVCGRSPGASLHVQIAPGVEVPDHMRRS